MENIYELIQYVENNEFSIELLNYCKDYFHYYISTEDEKEQFLQVFQTKLQEKLPMLGKNTATDLVHYLILGGGFKIEDIIFMDDAILSEEINEVKSIDFVGSQTNTFKESDSVSFVDAFTRFCNDKDLGKKFSRELNEIYLKHYGISVLPESPNWKDNKSGVPWVRFAINRSEGNIVQSYQNGEELTFKMISQNKDKKNILVEIEISPSKNNSLKVKSISDYVIRLSDLLQKKDMGYPYVFDKTTK